MPMHPKCFEIFKLASLRKFGKVDIDGLFLLIDVSGPNQRNGLLGLMIYGADVNDQPMPDNVFTRSDSVDLHGVVRNAH